MVATFNDFFGRASDQSLEPVPDLDHIKVFIENYRGEKLDEALFADFFGEVKLELHDLISIPAIRDLSINKINDRKLLEQMSSMLTERFRWKINIKRFEKWFDLAHLYQNCGFVLVIPDPDFVVEASKTPGEKLLEMIDEVFINPPPAPTTPLTRAEHSKLGYSGYLPLAPAPPTGSMRFDVSTQMQYYFDGQRWQSVTSNPI